MAEAKIPWLDCTNAYEGYFERTLWVSPYDNHPNAKGHALIARCVLSRLESHPLVAPLLRPRIDAAAGY